jgi:ankyrin repeat protein
MTRPSIDREQYFLNAILELREHLNTLKTNDSLQDLNVFENQLTLNELERCFSEAKDDDFDTKLTELLAQRWERIRNSSMGYTQKPNNRVNQLCLELAKEIAPPVTTEAEIKALKPNTGPYFLLMPSLAKSEDIYGENIHCFGLNEFVLSDQERVFIPVAECLHQASISDEGRLRHLVLIDENNPELLSPDEIKRVTEHSKQAKELYTNIHLLNRQRLFGDEIGSKLRQLANALRKGGAHAAGSEFNAGAVANEGIIAFSEYWDNLPEMQKEAILTNTPELDNIIGRLFRPNDTNFQNVRYCVEILAQNLDPIIQKYNTTQTIENLTKKVSTQETLFEEAVKKGTLQISPNTNPPKHIMHLIHQLSPAEQKNIFKHTPYKNALEFVLANAPEILPELALDEAAKQKAISIKLSSTHDSALIVAAKNGKTQTINLLLNWKADIEARDKAQNTALHWAANNGHTEAVNCLIEHGAQLEAKGIHENTALHFAVIHGKNEVVNLLLTKNAHINARNKQGKNALDLALQYHPDLVEPILMHMAKLPLEEQAKCLLKVPGGPFPNVLFYSAVHKPELCKTLLNDTLKQSNSELMPQFLKTSNKQKENLLTLAAQVGAHESIPKLLDLGFSVEYQDLNQKTLLYYAARNGHVETVKCLLEHGASLESKSAPYGQTALNIAVAHGKKDIVDLLLKQNANINVRNKSGHNALDLAIKYHPELVEPLLIQIAKLPAEAQAEHLLNVPKGPFVNALFCSATLKPHLFKVLLDQTLQQSDSQLISSIRNASNERGSNLLILAAKIGAHESIPKLLNLGFNIECKDLYQSNPLHWAANNGFVEAVKCLLEHGAQLESKGAGDNTALDFAIAHGKRDVVNLLLTKNANINARNKQGKNALDLALQDHPELTEPILMHMAKLPLEEQAKCLLKVPGGPFPNVALYIAAQKQNLFNPMIKHLYETDRALIHSLFNTSNEKECNPLILAARAGAEKSIPLLLDLGFKIESQDLGQRTALQWAALRGSVETVNCLLEHGSSLEAQGGKYGQTALNVAVAHGKKDIVDLLLKKNASISIRDNVGNNPLDVAIKYQPKLVETLLMHLAKLPIDKQAQCLEKIPGGPYPNVLFYAAIERPDILNKLLSSNESQSLTEIHLNEHLHEIGVHYKKMIEKSTNYLDYKPAVSTTKDLLKTCTEAIIKFDQSNQDIDKKMFSMKNTCKNAIDTARPVLKNHRGWGKILEAFQCAVSTVSISLARHTAQFFSEKTKSERLLDKLQEEIEKPPLSKP